MVKQVLKANFGRQILEWENNVIPMKDPGNLIGQTNLTKSDMREVVMNT